MLNARTDAYVTARGRDPEDVLGDAVERGRAFLTAGADCVFVPLAPDAATIGRLVEGIGERRVSVLVVPGGPAPEQLGAMGVARVSFGPWTHRVALAALADTAADLLAGAPLPPDVPARP